MKQIDANRLKTELARLYSDASKHSSYQSIPYFVSQAIGYHEIIDENWRGDKLRLDYVLSRLDDPSLINWGDFGANTGFFSLSLAHDSPSRKVLSIEANANHANFIQRIASEFELENLTVLTRPVSRGDLLDLPRQDVLLHLNVLHHAGADFDEELVSGPEDFLPYARNYLERLHTCTRILVFQVGTNLWGNKSLPIVDFRDDVKKYRLLSELLENSGWVIDDVAYPTRDATGAILYRSLGRDREHVELDRLEATLRELRLTEHVGEFYRRPIFICSSPRTASP